MNLWNLVTAPLRRSLRARLAASIALVHAVLMVIFVIDLTGRERDILNQQLENKAMQGIALLARSSREWVMARDLAGLDELMEPFRTETDTVFTMIFDHQGRILAHSDKLLVGHYLDDPLSLSVISQPEARARIIQRTAALIDTVAPIEAEGRPFAWARIGLRNPTDAALRQAVDHGMLYVLAAILIGSLLALLIAGDLTRDLRRLMALLGRVGEGALDQRIEVGREDELGHVMTDLNRTLDRLEQDEQTLHQTKERLQLALVGSNDGLWDWDLTTNQVFFSPRWKTMLGYAEEEIGSSLNEWSERVHPEDLAHAMEAVQAHLRGETRSYEDIHRMRHKDGSWRWILDRGVALRDEHAEPYRMVGTHTDITELKQTSDQLALESARLQNLLQTLHAGVLMEGADRSIALVNQGFCTLFEISADPSALVGTSCIELGARSAHLFNDPPGAWACIEQRIHALEPVVGEIIQMADGRTLERDYSPIGVHGRHEGHLWMYRDISPRIELERDLHAQKERLRVILLSMADGVIVTNSEGLVEFLNPAAENLTGFTLDEAIHQPIEAIARLCESETGRWLNHDLIQDMMAQGSHGIPARLIRDGDLETVFNLELSVARIRDDHATAGLVLILHDVSETHRLIEQISWQAVHDPLTGLPNRTGFATRMKTLLASARENGEQHVLLYMDLDQFKVVNDTCGHAAGDELLMNIANILREGVRRDDMIARLGGDEFGGLLPNCSIEAAERIARQLRENVQNFSFYWQDRVFSVGVSIGIVSISADWDTSDDILRAADIACYAAKEEGRNRVHVYQPADDAMSERVEQLGMAAQIQLALREERFVLYAQPLKPLGLPGSQDGLYLEVLVRMVDRDGKIVSPGLFISAAERYNHMQAVDRWVVSATLQQLHQALSTAGTPPLRHVAINLSGHSLTHEGMLEFIESELLAYAFPPGLICFEITETAIISNLKQALAFIQRMKALGCTFALDDFGSGLSSFAYLKALPVDYLKIDGVFVRDIESDPHDRSFVQAINHVGHTLGLQTIAEFVENDATERLLHSMGVDFAQGYGISPPKPLENFFLSRSPA